MSRPFPKQRSEGQAALVAVLFFVFISMTVVGGFSSFVASELQQVKTFEKSKRSYVFAEGALEDGLYRLKSGKNMPATVEYGDSGLGATTTVTDLGDTIEVETRGADFEARRAVKAALQEGSAASFNYGVQVGDGGMQMQNTSSVHGNIFSNGPITGENQNLIYGDVISGGSNGLTDGIHATGTAYAHTIRNSRIDRDAYFETISGTTVGGVLHPGSADQTDKELAISDATISQWETAAAANVIHCADEYQIKNNTTIGPVKIECNVEIEGSAVVTVAGPIWIAGNLKIQNSANIRVDPSLGSKSVALIADNLSNRTTSSKVSAENTSTFAGSGAPNSYVLLVSQNSSAEQGGGETAITIKNSATGDLLVYARHGKIQLQNSAALREVSGYAIQLMNTTDVTYKAGLANLLFETGPAGGFIIDSWKEIQ